MPIRATTSGANRGLPSSGHSASVPAKLPPQWQHILMVPMSTILYSANPLPNVNAKDAARRARRPKPAFKFSAECPMSHAERARRPSADSRTAWRRRRRSDSWAGKTWLDAEKVGVVPQDLHRLVQQDVAVRRCGSALTVARLVVRLVILLVILLGRHGRRQAGRGGVLERD